MRESDYWLSLLEFMEMGNSEQRKSLLHECGEFIRIFSTSLQTHKDNDAENK